MNEPMSKRVTDLAARGRAVTYESKRAVMTRLLRAWDAAPVLRLGQFLMAVCEHRVDQVDLFHVEDEHLASLAEAMAVVPDAETLTHSEKALAKILASVEEWRASGGHDGSCEADVVVDACRPLVATGLLFPGTGQLMSGSRDLLARARRAGVL